MQVTGDAKADVSIDLRESRQSHVPADPQSRPAAGPPSGFRADIEGLRAVSVLLVVACHAGVPFLTGGFVGVDVFFVISGFLITGLLVRETERTGRLSIRDFYARRARRILPMAALVLVSICVAAWLLIPAINRAGVGADVTGAALFVSNWVFAIQANDYWAMDVTSSPVLHFWSLSVEEQFYLIWPVLILFLALFARRRRMSSKQRRILLGAGLAVPVVASLVWALGRGADGMLGYYGLQTRLWELGAGGLAAVFLAGKSRLPLWAASLAAYAGLGMIAYAALTFSSTTPFPGANALWPVLGALLIVGAGSPGRRGIVVLSAAPMQYLGARSYNWYLWHWPFLVFAGVIVTGGGAFQATGEGSSLVAGTAIASVAAVALSLAVTVITFRFIETPMRHLPFLKQRPNMTLAASAAAIALTVAAAFLIAPAAGASTEADSAANAAADAQFESAAPLTVPKAGFDATVWPIRDAAESPEHARAGLVPIRDECYAKPEAAYTFAGADNCAYGDLSATKKIAIVGDSHARAWLPAFDSLGRAHRFKVYVWSATGCPAVRMLEKGPGSQQRCDSWRAGLTKQLNEIGGFEAVVLLSLSRLNAKGDIDDNPAISPEEWRRDAGADFARSIQGATERVIQTRGNYFADFDVPTCLANHDGSTGKCSFDRVRVDDPVTAAELAGVQDVLGDRASQIDLGPLMCPTAMAKCPAVAPDGTIILRDDNHPNAAMSRVVAPELWPLIKPILKA